MQHRQDLLFFFQFALLQIELNLTIFRNYLLRFYHNKTFQYPQFINQKKKRKNKKNNTN
ncbi:hypothetical protein BP50_002175, partial [Kingella potus DSM 18304]